MPVALPVPSDFMLFSFFPICCCCCVFAAVALLLYFRPDSNLLPHFPAFMVAVQFFFTLCFCGLLATLLQLLMYLFCINDYYKVHVLRSVGVTLLSSSASGAVALVVFGVYGDGRDFMPDWEHNYHSWSFGLACVGVILQVGRQGF